VIAAQIILLLIAFLFGLHDGCTHRDNRLITPAKRKLWHFSGALLYTAFTAALCVRFEDWRLVIAAVILRAAIFDIGYNVGASITPTYIGDGVENIEAAMVKIFGKQGAYWKALSFLALLVGLNLIF